MTVIDKLIKKIGAYPSKIKIVFPEGENKLIQEAAQELCKHNIEPILVFASKVDSVTELHPGCQCIMMNEYNLSDLGNKLYSYRSHKLTNEVAHKLIKQPNYFGVMLVKEGIAHGMVGGITYATKDIIGPALQIIKGRPGIKIVSSVFLMLKEDTSYIFTDCALNLYPNSEQLAEIGKSGYEAAELFQFNNPSVAFLSYSTVGSGKGQHVDIVSGAVNKLKVDNWDKCPFDGELQFDSAFATRVRNKKAPNSSLLNEPANIYVFPNLDAANIGYKIAQYLGGFDAIGPVIMGLDKPVNDLSRGASTQDIIKMAVITAYNYIQNEIKGK